MNRIAATCLVMMLLAAPAAAGDVTISKGTGGEIVITGGKRTAPKVETQAEADARRAAQERAFDAGAGTATRQQEAQERPGGGQAAPVTGVQVRAGDGMQGGDTIQAEVEVQAERAIMYERQVFKTRGAYIRARDKLNQTETQERAVPARQQTQQP